MGQMYAWATPDYLLNGMTLEEVFFYYDQGLKFEEYKAALIIHKLNDALDDKKQKKQAASPKSDKPDKKAFYARHGDKIKRPPKEGE